MNFLATLLVLGMVAASVTFGYLRIRRARHVAAAPVIQSPLPAQVQPSNPTSETRTPPVSEEAAKQTTADQAPDQPPSTSASEQPVVIASHGRPSNLTRRVKERQTTAAAEAKPADEAPVPAKVSLSQDKNPRSEKPVKNGPPSSQTRITTTTVSPQLIEPSPTAPAKPKVIQWP